MNFGEAIEAAKAGKCIQREAWKGWAPPRGVWVGLTPGSVIRGRLESYPPKFAPGQLTGVAKMYADAEATGGEIVIGGHFDMRAADGTLEIGWRPSQADMLADDWSVVGE